MTTIDRRTLLSGSVAALAAPAIPNETKAARPPASVPLRPEDELVLIELRDLEAHLSRAKALLEKAMSHDHPVWRSCYLLDMRIAFQCVTSSSHFVWERMQQQREKEFAEARAWREENGA